VHEWDPILTLLHPTDIVANTRDPSPDRPAVDSEGQV
jgi:hypothetical protein